MRITSQRRAEASRRLRPLASTAKDGADDPDGYQTRLGDREKARGRAAVRRGHGPSPTWQECIETSGYGEAEGFYTRAFGNHRKGKGANLQAWHWTLTNLAMRPLC